MEAAVKKASLERGHDPREFTLVAFGGAGPMHACELAESLEIPRVLVPHYPGLFSSTGLLLADAGRDYTRTVLKKLYGAGPTLSSVSAALKKQATEDMRAEGFARGRLRFTVSLAIRYAGQSHEIELPMPSLSRDSVVRYFEDAYRAAYGYLRPASEIEVVNVRVSCRAPHQEVPLSPPARARGPALPLGRRAIYFGNRRLASDVFARRDIGAGRSITGPALVVQEDTTTVVPPGWRAAHDLAGSLELEAAR
jgi:N-methylhydantoinase A